MSKQTLGIVSPPLHYHFTPYPDLTERGLWNEDVKNQMIAAGGSIQGIATIPDDLKALYKTVWEIKQKVGIDVSNIAMLYSL